MDSQALKLTVDQFLRGPQEIVLIHRHGRAHQSDRPTLIGAKIRSDMKEALRSREINSHVKFGVQETVIELTTDGFHENEGHLCKVVFLPPQHAEDRRTNPNPPELLALELAGWVAAHFFATPPLGLRLYYHVFGKGGEVAEVEQSWCREFALAAEENIRPLVVEQTRRIGEAFTRPDETLPECTVEERDAAPGSEYSKCRDWCPARKHCEQIHRHYREETERSLAGERALASIVAEEGLSFAERRATRRKEQISAMMMAGNFFEDDFPREVFRKLILDEAEDESTDRDKASAYREMATFWSDAKFVAWRAWLDREE